MAMDTRADERLRRALEPRPESVERVVRGALGERRPARRPRLAPALGGALALLALAALFLARPRPKAPVSIENVGEVLIVRHQEGGRVLIHNGEAAGGSPPSGSMIVIHGGTR
jgi:hypothetical protein